ncbi:MAG: two-component regulator propeller domain-containing protein [bacterium]|nr:two-component regulator propeller domain-containing protein [bacterium]
MSKKDELRQKGRFDLRDQWTNFTTEDGLADNDVWSILEDRTGNLWFGTFNNGVSKYDGKKWFHYPKKRDGLPDNRVFSIIEDKSGNLWFGTWGGGVSKYDLDSSKFSAFPRMNTL